MDRGRISSLVAAFAEKFDGVECHSTGVHLFANLLSTFMHTLGDLGIECAFLNAWSSMCR